MFSDVMKICPEIKIFHLSPCGRGRRVAAGEGQLWYHLRSRRFQGWKFRRQHILQGYIVDFICFERKVVIELDGGQHTTRKTYDNHRTRLLTKDGFKVISFWNNDVLNNLESVLETILSTPHPSLRADLSHKGRGEKSNFQTNSHQVPLQ
jgi:very-short-patch-repair endonuclease